MIADEPIYSITSKITTTKEAFEDSLERGGEIEAVGAQHIGDAAIEAFDHAVGLGSSGPNQAMTACVSYLVMKRRRPAVFTPTWIWSGFVP